MSDVGDLLVLTFGNFVLKADWLSGLWNYTYIFMFFYVFFSKSKKNMTFSFFRVVAPIFSNAISHVFFVWTQQDVQENGNSC